MGNPDFKQYVHSDRNRAYFLSNQRLKSAAW